jgi:hypothetical protein
LGIPPTQVTPEWMTAVQEEIAGVVEASGAALVKADNTQLLAALNALYANVSSLAMFGDGSDGDFAAAAGTTTLTRDMYWNKCTLTGTAKIVTAGYRIFVKDSVTGLDISNAGAGAITADGNNGGNAASGVGGAAPAAQASGTIGVGAAGVAGSTGGVNGLPGNAANPGNGGSGGKGGNNLIRNGGAKGSASNFLLIRRWIVDLLRGVTLLLGGASGGSGAGPDAGIGASGGTGNAGGVVYIAARTITRSAITAAGAISAKGGLPGACFDSGSININAAGGSAGSAGGWIVVIYRSLLGVLAGNALNANGSAGGNGANSTGGGTPTAGDGGDGADGGRITLINIATAAVTETVGTVGSAGTAHAGTVPGNGGANGTCAANL